MGLFPAEEPYGLFDMFEVDPGIKARPEGTLVRDPEDGHRESVHNAAAQIPLAGHGDYCLGTHVLYDLSGEVAPGCYEQIQIVFVSDLNKILYLASPAPLAIVNIIGESDVALIHLEAMWKEKENTASLGFRRPQEPVVQVDNNALKFLFLLG